MREYTIDQYDRNLEKDWTCDKKKNRYITETAGFKPLEAQIAAFEQAGHRAKFRSDMFDSSDYNEMYLSPDLRITQEDDEIDTEEKLRKQAFFRRMVAEQKEKGMQRESLDSIMKEYAELKRREAERQQSMRRNDTTRPPAAGAETD